MSRTARPNPRWNGSCACTRTSTLSGSWSAGDCRGITELIARRRWVPTVLRRSGAIGDNEHLTCERTPRQTQIQRHEPVAERQAAFHRERKEAGLDVTAPKPVDLE